jgi:hypothetical protein
MRQNSILMSVFIILQSCLLPFMATCHKPGKVKKIVFSVMGDVPRSLQEDTLLQKQIEEHNLKSPSQMMFHVGDIKSGGDPCSESVYKKVSGFLKKLDVPVLIVPGDNEWNDCDNPTQAWTYWEKYFLKFDKNWKVRYHVEYQPEQPENFAFRIKDILFIGINLVGGRVHNQDVWNEKMQNDALWIKKQLQSKEIKAAVLFAQANPKEKHELFMKHFKNAAIIFKKPILFIHGDGHRWIYDNPWLEQNIIRVQVDQGKIADPLQVTVQIDKEIKFEFEREPFK